MKRRQFIRYAGAGVLSTVGLQALSQAQPGWAQAQGGVGIQYLGHTCFLFTGGGTRILVNPFRSLGCTAGYRPPKVNTDLVLISSQLLDEGAIEILPGNPKLLYESGSYQLGGRQIEGIRTDHDLLNGNRFGTNIVWKWQQGGVNILHLGGAAAPITPEQKILMGRPDVVMIPVGNGPKAYSPAAAKDAIAVLNPKIIVPTHYRTAAAQAPCELVPLDDFLKLMTGTPVRQMGSSTTITASSLPKSGSVIHVMRYA